MGARNKVGIGLSYRPASLWSLATQFQTRFLVLIFRSIAGLKFSTQTLLLTCRAYLEDVETYPKLYESRDPEVRDV
jgi:hypothetical protein